MKTEIKQILEMSRKGVIDDEQAAELLSALHGEQAEEPAEQPRARTATIDMDLNLESLGEAIEEGITGIGVVIKKTLCGITQEWGEGNDAVLSTIKPPQMDADSCCEGNDINVSTVKGIRLVRGRFCENSINAGKVRDIRVSDGTVERCAINGAALAFELERGQMADCSFNGCKVADLVIRDSQVLELAANGVKLREGRIEGCRLERVELNGVVLDQVCMERSRLQGVTFRGSNRRGKMKRLTLRDAELVDCVFAGCEMVGTRFEGVRLEGVTIEDRDLSGMVITDASQLEGAA